MLPVSKTLWTLLGTHTRPKQPRCWGVHSVRTDNATMQDGIRLSLADFLCVPLLIPKYFACLHFPVPCSLPISKLPCSDPSCFFWILLFCHSDTRNSVKDRYVHRGFRNRECSMPDFHLYACEKCLLTFSFQGSQHLYTLLVLESLVKLCCSMLQNHRMQCSPNWL